MYSLFHSHLCLHPRTHSNVPCLCFLPSLPTCCALPSCLTFRWPISAPCSRCLMPLKATQQVCSLSHPPTNPTYYPAGALVSRVKTAPARVLQAELEALCCQPATLGHCQAWTMTWDTLHAAKKSRSVRPRTIFKSFCWYMQNQRQFDLCMVRLMANALNTTYTRQTAKCQEITDTITGWRDWFGQLILHTTPDGLEFLLELIGTAPDSPGKPMTANGFRHVLILLANWWSLKAHNYPNSDALRLTGWIRSYLSAHPNVIDSSLTIWLISKPSLVDDALVLSTIEQCHLLSIPLPKAALKWIISHFHMIPDGQRATLLRRALPDRTTRITIASTQVPPPPLPSIPPPFTHRDS